MLLLAAREQMRLVIQPVTASYLDMWPSSRARQASVCTDASPISRDMALLLMVMLGQGEKAWLVLGS